MAEDIQNEPVRLKMRFKGSRNFVSEHVYDMIWESKAGTKIVIEILEDDCTVEYN